MLDTHGGHTAEYGACCTYTQTVYEHGNKAEVKHGQMLNVCAGGKRQDIVVTVTPVENIYHI